jgi:peptidoglycan hydrolase CwlO-like protein
MNIPKTVVLLVLVALWSFPPAAAFAQLFGNEKENWDKVFTELKRINLHLGNIESVQIKSLQETQANILSQADKTQRMIPELKGKIEEIERKIAVMEAAQAEMRKMQKDFLVEFKAEGVEQSKQIRQGVAGDMESISKRSQDGMQKITESNAKSLKLVEDKLNEQNQHLTSFHLLFKDELIPKFVDLSHKNREAILAEVNKSKNETVQAVRGDNETVAEAQARNRSSLLEVNEKLGKLIDILKTMAGEQAAMHGQLAEVRKRVGAGSAAKSDATTKKSESKTKSAPPPQ